MASARASRTIRGSALATFLTCALLLPATARAATCSTLDASCATTPVPSGDPATGATNPVTGTVGGLAGAGTIGDTVDPAAGAVERAVHDVTDAGGRVADTVTDTVDDTANQAGGTVGRGVDQVTTTIDRVLNGPDGGAAEPPSGPVSGRSDGSGASNGRHGGRSAGFRGSDGQAERRARAVPTPPTNPSRGFGRLPGSSSSTAFGSSANVPIPPAARRPAGFLESPVGRLIIGIAKGLAFPVAVILVIVGFVAVQHRIDRRAPKIARAALRRDIVRFS